MALFEVRHYTVLPGKMEEWVTFIEQEIIPFVTAKGMVVCGSFQGIEDETTYIWLRRFNDEQHRDELYKAVYESDEWKTKLLPRVKQLLDREKTIVHKVVPTSRSSVQ